MKCYICKKEKTNSFLSLNRGKGVEKYYLCNYCVEMLCGYVAIANPELVVRNIELLKADESLKIN